MLQLAAQASCRGHPLSSNVRPRRAYSAAFPDPLGVSVRSSFLVVAVLLAGCASADKVDVPGAAVTPLNDLNLVNAPIPEVLRAAQRSPYAIPEVKECAAISKEIRSLDEVLGPDLDAPATESNPGLIERGGDLVGGAIKNAAEGVVPFRSWVRKLSGAERYSKQVAAAIAAGTVRRAFLKGIRSSLACT